MTLTKLENLIENKYYLIYDFRLNDSQFSAIFKNCVLCRVVQNFNVRWLHNNTELLAPLAAMNNTWLYFELSDEEALKHYVMDLL